MAVLAGLFLLAPLLQAASVAGFRALSFAADRPWNYVAYGLAAPWVAWLLWRRRPRARFAAYVFLTHEIARGFHFGSPGAVVAAFALLGWLQLPAVRRWSPSLRPSDFCAWRGRAGSRGAGL